ncbi:MAG TPA: tyrosine--tRNA ligase [Acidimicrobiia bacterium]|nr:tyrosine--tRNA ligase [Acidimicrobiia bacterium]
MAGPDVEEQLRVLRAGTIDCITEDELRDKLGAGRPLRVKLGLDPTASDIHLGSAVVLRKLRAFQDLGHVAVLIIGDFTARVGDPSGRSATRPALSPDEIDAHATTYVDQARRILLADKDRLEVRYNSEWLNTMDMADVLRLTSRVTVARVLERNDFSARYEAGDPISLMELLYPLLQGWDSVMIDADVELGGTDQLFNILMGRHLQEQVGQPPQIVLTNPLLVGIGGGEKMSKSVGNHVGITEPPRDQFGKLMRISDDLMPDYVGLTTGWGPDRVNDTLAELGHAAPADRARLKRLLARSVVDLYHGEGAGDRAEAEFDRVFKEHAAPSDVEEFVLRPEELRNGKIEVARLLALAGLVGSNREGRRKITQGGVYLDGERVTEPSLEVTPGDVDGRALHLGRRGWRRIRAG